MFTFTYACFVHLKFAFIIISRKIFKSLQISICIFRRGLTPPHRVKSISMATFSQEEIDFIKEHGNDYCRRVWLGLMNMNPPLNLDTKDEQKMKDLMSAKYELKRYYLDPSIANQNNTAQQKSSSSNSSGIPRVPNSGTLPAPVGQKSIDNAEPRNNLNNSNNFSTDFVADFSKVPSDPFCPATTNHFGQQPIAPQPFFANFDNNPIFNNSNSEYKKAFFFFYDGIKFESIDQSCLTMNNFIIEVWKRPQCLIRSVPR